LVVEEDAGVDQFTFGHGVSPFSDKLAPAAFFQPCV